jgi:hypothetical protein
MRKRKKMCVLVHWRFPVSRQNRAFSFTLSNQNHCMQNRRGGDDDDDRKRKRGYVDPKRASASKKNKSAAPPPKASAKSKSKTVEDSDDAEDADDESGGDESGSGDDDGDQEGDNDADDDDQPLVRARNEKPKSKPLPKPQAAKPSRPTYVNEMRAINQARLFFFSLPDFP